MNDGLTTFREGTSLGPQLTARVWNKLIEVVRRNTVMPGPNTLMNQGPGGTQIWGGRGQAKARRDQVLRTLFVQDASTTGPAVAKIGVTYGQINNITPTLGGSSLRVRPAPTLTVVTGVVYLHATVDAAGAITALAIENAASVPANTATHGYLVLAELTVTDNAISTLDVAGWNWSQMQKCGELVYNWGGFGE